MSATDVANQKAVSGYSSKNKEAAFLEQLTQYNMHSPEFKSPSIEACAMLIKGFYEDNYRHKYSNIAEYIYSQNSADSDAADFAVGSCRELINDFGKDNNMELLRDGDETTTFSSNRYIYQLNKLIDHIELERFRSKTLDEQAAEFNRKLQDGSKRIDNEMIHLQELQTETEDAKNKIEKLNEKLDKQELGFVGTLGIFAGIVMAFSGTFTVISSAIENLNVFNIYNITFTTVLLGCVLTNIIFVLFYCISLILNRNLTHKCIKSGNLLCSECNTRKQNKDEKACAGAFFWRNSTVIIVNAIYVLVLAGIVIYKIITPFLTTISCKTLANLL